uniref:HAUS augmin-like complex subunit 6 N-terminal domain-containing protein n=2 Tax=Anopheles culicifacies TaxID=139723 RepID=A0A182MT81_9DIPT
MPTCAVIKVNKPTRKLTRLSRKRLSLRPSTGKTRPRFIMSKKPSVKRTNSQLSVGQNASCTPVSRCEEQLDAAIYRCLHALTKRHQPTDEFRAQFCRGAFLKSNTKAFIQVMHFLLNIYDAREFRKRFYWPIYDKGAENAFRTSTVEYVNHLIERGKLVGMEKIKAHVVVLPGGAKFMKFLLTFIRFVLQEELRRAKGGGAGDGEPITKKRIAQMMASHKRWVDVGERIGGIVQEDTSVLTEKTRKIDALIETVLQGSDVAKQINYDKLMEMWTVLIDTQFREQQKIRERMENIGKEFERVIEKTGSKLKANELSLPFTKEQLKDCLGHYTCQPGTELHQLTQDVFDGSGKLNPIKLLQLFETILPSIERFFVGFCMKNQELMKYEHKELSKVAVKFDDMRQQLDVLQRSLPMLEECLLRDLPGAGDSPNLGKDNFAIKNKLFCTPPIVMDFDAQADDFPAVGPNGRSSHRLALLNKEDVHAMNARMKLLSVSSYQPRSPKPPQKYQKHTADQLTQQQQQQSGSVVFAVPRITRKEKLNPLTMLNRIKAQSQKQNGTTRSNECARVNNTMNISTLSEITLRPEFSSTLLGTPEKVAPGAMGRTPNEDDMERKASATQTLQLPVPSHQPQMKRVTDSPNIHSSPRLMVIYAESNTPKSSLSPKTLLQRAPVTKRTSSKRSSLIEHESTVHTSPSGRLESLIKHDELPPRCQLPMMAPESEEEKENIAGNHQNSGDLSDEKTLNAENGDLQEDLSRTLMATSIGSLKDGTAIERIVDQKAEDQLQHIEELDDDNLFNVSDGIVTDFHHHSEHPWCLHHSWLVLCLWEPYSMPMPRRHHRYWFRNVSLHHLLSPYSKVPVSSSSLLPQLSSVMLSTGNLQHLVEARRFWHEHRFHDVLARVRYTELTKLCLTATRFTGRGTDRYAPKLTLFRTTHRIDVALIGQQHQMVTTGCDIDPPIAWQHFDR